MRESNTSPSVSALSRLTQPLYVRLTLFLLFSALGVNLFIYTSFDRLDRTTLDFTIPYILYPINGTPVGRQFDSWRPMYQASHLANTDNNKTLYDDLFFEQRIKFQYAPTSLLLLHPLKDLPLHQVSVIANTASWLAVILIAILVYRIFALAMHRYIQAWAPSFYERSALLALAFGYTLTFYPIVRSFLLGQVQTWITLFFAALLWTWLLGRKGVSGALGGLICIIKPQLGLLLLWGILRKEWRFVAGFAVVLAITVPLSLYLYGLANHIAYLDVLSYIAKRGEAFYANQSMNGLLNRLFFNGVNLKFDKHGFAPYNPWIYVATLLSSIALISLALFWRARDRGFGKTEDLLIATLSFTLASPIAWEHHYGLLLPMFAYLVPATLGSGIKRTGTYSLAIAFLLCCNLYQFTNYFAHTWLNFVQSYLFFGALLVLVHLYRLRATKSPPVGA